MNNSWKGMAVGAFCGAAIGIVMDLAAKGTRRATELGASVKHAVQEKAPEARDWVETQGHRATEWVREQDLPDKAKHLADRVNPD